MSKIELDEQTKEVLEDTLSDRIASLAIAGCSTNKISKELNLTAYRVTKIMNSDEFRAKLKDLSDKYVANAANAFKAAMGERIPEALRVIDENLKKNNLQAVMLIAKAVGVEKPEAVQQQSGTIQVILPEMPKPVKDIEV